MAVNADQLADGYNEIQERFSLSPYVKIISTEGDPPSSYHIEYRIKGLTKNAAEQVVESSSHRVEITLPFGYPHFPPNCKPLTSIFHPDIDPDVIRIGDFWDGSHSLVDLIVHIGNLITFQKYSTEDVFNQEALEWTTAHNDNIPLEKIDFTIQEAASDTFGDTEGISLTLESEEEPEIPRIQEDKSDPPPKAPVAPQTIKKGESSNLFMIIGGSIFLIITVIGLIEILDVRNHNKATQHWENIQTLVDQNEFTEANPLIVESQKRLESIKFLKKKSKEQLLKKINELVVSERFQQGLQGRILVNGVYLSGQELHTSKELSELIAKGSRMAEASKWQNASDAFELADNKAKELEEKCPLPLADIEELLTRSHVMRQVESGNSERSQGKWTQAKNSYEVALNMLTELKKKQKVPTDRSITKTSNIKILDKARNNTGPLGITQVGIRRKILSASIEKEEYKATSYLKQEEYSQAIQSLRRIVSLITKSSFAKEKKFTSIKESAAHRIQENSFLQLIQEKTTYLYANYQNFFKEKFDSAATSNLSDPEIEFFKSAGNVLVFKMVCKEEIRRQKYNLEMFSQYDTVSQTWSVYQ
jgi:ubiquitin-protein ligase/tetratricopeptide (TPR) repeat protein